MKLFFLVDTVYLLRTKDSEEPPPFLYLPTFITPINLAGSLIMVRKYVLPFFPLQVSIEMEVENLGNSFRSICDKEKEEDKT